jgi:hypothetical protein
MILEFLRIRLQIISMILEFMRLSGSFQNFGNRTTLIWEKCLFQRIVITQAEL